VEISSRGRKVWVSVMRARRFLLIGFRSLWDLSGELTYRDYMDAQRRRKRKSDWENLAGDWERILPESRKDKS
jgi:hypothetical protein